MLEKGHSEADADKYVDEIKESTVYELLVIKKEIKAPEPVIEDEDEEEDASYFRRLRGVVRYED
jgi:hypothetical protein